MDTLPEMERLADRVIVLETPEPFWAVGAHYERFDLETPEPFWAVGAHYERFDQTSDEEVIELLRKSRENNQASS